MNKINCTIVECNVNDANFLKIYLQNNPYINKVNVFDNAYDGLIHIAKCNVDLIFFNKETPYALASGYLLKSAKFTPYVIVTTSQKEKQNNDTKTQTRVLGCLEKPFATELLDKYLNKVMQIVLAKQKINL